VLPVALIPALDRAALWVLRDQVSRTQPFFSGDWRIVERQGYKLTLAIRGNHHYRPGRCVKLNRVTSH
jgi:hypothetical protein